MEDVVVCHSVLAVTCVGKDCGVWITAWTSSSQTLCFSQRKIKSQLLCFLPSFCCTFQNATQEKKKKVFIIIVFVSSYFNIQFLVWYVMHWNTVPLWKQKDCFLFFFFVQKKFCLSHSMHIKSRWCQIFRFKMRNNSHFTNLNVAPSLNHKKRVCNWACLIKSFSCLFFTLVAHSYFSAMGKLHCVCLCFYVNN